MTVPEDAGERAADVVVVGAGPAGITAALGAARGGRRVALLEKAARPGVKILISGGNRCNLTHDCSAAEIAGAFGREGGRFLGHALRELGPRELRAWIETLGVATKVEPGGKVFPVSNRAVEVRDALEAELRRAGVHFCGHAAVTALECRNEVFRVHSSAGTWRAPRLVLALGGCSYPKVGTTGDGYALAQALGHTLVAPTPALVPLLVNESWVQALSGLTLEDAQLTVPRAAAQREARVRGGLLFTHFGLSGPAPMNLGSTVAERLAGAVPPVEVTVDFLPATRRAAVEALLVQSVAARDSRLVRTLVGEWLPRRLAQALTDSAGIPPELPVHQLGGAARVRLLEGLFSTRLTVAGTRGFAFAEVTRGGVALSEVDPSTLASRRVPGLYFAGEILDLDGPIGGYNFTAAFATGALAGRSAAGA